ncbi:MAG: GNAT family N-acetyltransferase [Paraburkholderia sp.]|uniref:GNAT family N-acetyltransferase n=1 Tax=Paraburkholderia sp. TaxID=1926495 RepID=UPI003C5143B0
MSRSSPIDLDRPIWTALTTRQAHLGNGDALARRYHSDVAPFAALASETPAAYEALHQLLKPDEQVALLSAEPLVLIDALHPMQIGMLHQMIATHHEGGSIDDRDVIRLGSADTQDMLDLVEKTKPGPFGKRTREMGNYIGIRDQGRLIAMAGERMCIDGYVEISAVCVDDDWRGKGLAGRLMKILHREIVQRDETPFLHVFSSNRSAITLYERLGFEVRRTFHLTRVKQAEPGSAIAG